MMLKDLIKKYSIIHIAGREYKVRYSLNCLLCLEMTYKPLSEILKIKYADWETEDVLQLVRAAMCDMHQNYKAVNRRDFDHVKPSLAELGQMIDIADLPLLKLEIVNALIDSMPVREPHANNDEEPTSAAKEGHLRAMYCDILGRSDDEFWRSNQREIGERINFYLETKGLKDTPILVKNDFDDDEDI